MSSLAAAYHGYEHQDIVAAYAMAGLLLPRLGLRAITAERKTSDRDRFDDLQTHGSIRLRAQVKAHTSEGRVLRLRDLTTRAMDFRIDDVLAGAVQDSERVDQYRLFTTFGAPQADFLPYLQSATMVPPLLSGVETQRFTLIVDAIWPAAADPIWAALKGTDRDDFLDFCARFVLETGCPNSSHDLREPGPFESLLLRLLRDEIGIGYFPNDNRDLSDAAAHLIYLAHGARTESKTIEAAEVIRTLALRVDYGRVSERFPVVEDRMVLREQIVGDIERDLRQYTRVAVTASPGMGKSWLTHQIGEKLRADGWLVLTHYCFVDLFDNDRFRRASIRTTLGSLMAQLVDQERSVLGAVGPRFAANAEQFELMLKSAAAADPDRPILIVVDGIDHIDRLSDAHDSAAGLSAQLATLSLPTNAFIMVSSQPGKFLEEYTHAGHELSLRSWPDESIRALLSKSSLVDSLHSYGFETNHIADEIVRKAAGSPLYATYLARTAIAIARADPGFNDVGDIGSYLASAPAADPDLSSYYAWLVGGLTADLGVSWLSETLSWIDFPVTADELKEIMPMFQAYVDPVLGRLAPVLTQPSGRAGVRIYHESFQRYVRGRVSTGGADHVKSLLKAVIEWLNRRGFYADLRAFRWLFSVLKYAGRGDEIPGRVGDDFVISAVAHGQPGDAVMANIAAAARQSALTQDWTSLVRLHEIARSADNLYAWRLTNEHMIAVQYGRAFGSLHGVRALADRLLNDGKCTFQPGPGLLLCMTCDAGGEIPPWPEYLEADELDDGSSGAGYGPEGEAEVGLARITARMRLGGRSEAVSLCVDFLSDWRDGKVHPLSVAGELAGMYGEEALGEVVAALQAGMSRSWARFALARIARSDISRREQSELAIADGLPFEFWTACLRLGANPLTLSWDTGRLLALTAAVVSESVQFAPASLEEWLTGLAIAQAKGDQNALLACSNAIEPDTWYHKWLFFCIVLARRGTTEQILEAFRTLSEDIRVFHGRPRACDLYSLEPSIHRSFGRALGTLVDREAITSAIRYLAAISRGTTTWMRGTRSGPLTFDALLLLVLDSLSSASYDKITVIRAMAEEFAAGVSGGEFYDTHATDCLLLCRLNVIAGNGERATGFWNKACTYLAAYGWHKDVTAYDVIDPIEALGRADPIRTRAVLRTAQPIVEGVLVHTDGKSTSGLHDRWLNLAAQIFPEGTLNYLARSAAGQVPAPSVLHRFITKAAVAIDRSRTSALALSVGWLVAGMRGKTAFQTALLDLEAGIQSGLPTFISVWNVVVASMEGDNPESPPGFPRLVAESADRLHAFVPDLAYEREAKPDVAQPLETFSSRRVRPTQVEGPLFLAGASIPEIVRTIRRLRENGSLNPDAIVNSLGWRLLAMAERNTESVSLTLRLVAPDLSADRQNSVLEDLAVGFERHGKTELAALAFALAYTNGRNEWIQFGGALDLFQRAERLSSAIAWATLAEEVGDLVALGGSRSVSARVVELLLAAGRVDTAFNAWEAACRAVAVRLPRTGPEDDTEVAYCDDCQNRSEALAAVVTSSLNSLMLQDKQTALAALALIAGSDTSLFAFCVRFAITNTAPPWTLTVLLQVLVEFERAPYPATSSLVNELRVVATDGLLSSRMLAGLLLRRTGLFSSSSAQIDGVVRDAVRPVKRDHNRSPGDRVQAVERLLPGFSERFQTTMNQVRASNEMRRSMQRVLNGRLRMQHLEHDLNAWYPFDEEYERVLQQTASNLISESTAEGSDFERESRIGTALLGDVGLAVRSTLSRGTRPAYARAWGDVAAGGFVAEPFALEAGEFAGWIVASYLEVELVFGTDHDKQVKDRVLKAGGVVYDLAVDHWLDPIGLTDAAIWHGGQSSHRSTELRGPLGRLARFRGPFGDQSILTPHPICLPAAMLSLASIDAGLRFVDPRGRTAIVSRNWREQPRGEAEGDQIPKLHGHDLLIRADVFRAVSSRSPHAPRFIFSKGRGEA